MRYASNMEAMLFGRWRRILPWLLLVGCGEVEPATEDPLAGRTFLLDGADGYTPVPGTIPQVSFRDRRISVYAGCNHFGGAYSLSDDLLVVTDVSSTEMGCDPALSAQDDFFFGFVTSHPRWTIDGNALTLAGEAVSLYFLDREVANPDRPLVGPIWTVDTFIENDAASSVPTGVAPTVRFDDDGTLSVFSGCNSGTGRFEVDGGLLELSGLAYTEMDCEGLPPGVDEHVQAVMSAGLLTYEIEAARLTLRRGGVGLGATTE